MLLNLIIGINFVTYKCLVCRYKGWYKRTLAQQQLSNQFGLVITLFDCNNCLTRKLLQPTSNGNGYITYGFFQSINCLRMEVMLLLGCTWMDHRHYYYTQKYKKSQLSFQPCQWRVGQPIPRQLQILSVGGFL